MDQEKTYKWIQDRIRDLHAGRLSAEDRMRMEELAKTDPFVQDAMEGYQANPDHDHSVLLKVIADRIQNRKESRRPKILPLSKGWVIPAIAASLVLILATWVVMFYIEKQNDGVFVAAEPESSTIEKSTEVNLSDADSLEEEIALHEEKAGSREQGAGESSSLSRKSKKELERETKQNNDPGDVALDDEKNITPTMNSGRESNEQDVITSDILSSKKENSEPVLSQPEPISTQPSERGAVEMQADNSAPAGAAAMKSKSKKDEGLYANQMNPDLMSQRVSGNVRGRKGETLFGAQIAVKNSNLITTSDYYGKFELYIPDSISTIDVSLSGYKDTTMTVAKGVEDLTIMLDEKDIYSINDVLAGNATKHTFIHATDDTMSTQEPDYKLFSAYVKANSKYPVQDNFTFTCKEVKVGFTVEQNGRPKLFQKLKTDEDLKYSEEAFRLLKHGPDWQCDGDVYPCKREYTIYFK